MTPEEKAAELVREDGCIRVGGTAVAGPLGGTSHVPTYVTVARAAIAAAIREAEEAMRERCARECEVLIGQPTSLDATLAAAIQEQLARRIRNLPIGGEP